MLIPIGVDFMLLFLTACEKFCRGFISIKNIFSLILINFIDKSYPSLYLRAISIFLF